MSKYEICDLLTACMYAQKLQNTIHARFGNCAKCDNKTKYKAMKKTLHWCINNTSKADHASSAVYKWWGDKTCRRSAGFDLPGLIWYGSRRYECRDFHRGTTAEQTTHSNTHETTNMEPARKVQEVHTEHVSGWKLLFLRCPTVPPQRLIHVIVCLCLFTYF